MLNGLLDRETMSQYVLTVNATDTGNPPKRTAQNITITVSDVNDNPPRFLNRTYTANVSEAAPPLHEVSKLIVHLIWKFHFTWIRPYVFLH